MLLTRILFHKRPDGTDLTWLMWRYLGAESILIPSGLIPSGLIRSILIQSGAERPAQAAKRRAQLRVLD